MARLLQMPYYHPVIEEGLRTDLPLEARIAELRLEDRRAIGSVRLERVGTKSVTARAELRAPDGRMAAEAELVIVSRDPVTGTSRPLSEPERAAFEGARDE